MLYNKTVASLAEAWIETEMIMKNLLKGIVASLAEAWIETINHAYGTLEYDRRLPRGGVDRNDHVLPFRHLVGRRLPRGGVDRNASA